MSYRTSHAAFASALLLTSLLAVSCTTQRPADTLGVKDHPQTGQLADEGQMEQQRMVLECPCEHLVGQVPISGRVISWSSTVLKLEVTGIPIANAPASAPQVGDVLTGVYFGELPCQRGNYAPSAGDVVVGFLNAEGTPKPLCCDDCEERCSGGNPEEQDQCLAECQQPAQVACDEKFADLKIDGEFTLAPVTAENVRLGSQGGEEVSVPIGQLNLVFDGGVACEEVFGVDQDRIENAEPEEGHGTLLWQPSCSGN